MKVHQGKVRGEQEVCSGIWHTSGTMNDRNVQEESADFSNLVGRIVENEGKFHLWKVAGYARQIDHHPNSQNGIFVVCKRPKDLGISAGSR